MIGLRVVNDLALATLFGGGLFGKLAFAPASHRLDGNRTAAAVKDVAWGRYQVMQAASLAAVTVPWLSARWLGGRAVKADRGLERARDVLTLGVVGSGLGCLALGAALRRAHRNELAYATSGALADEPVERHDRLERLLKLFGNADLLFSAGLIAAGAIAATRR